MTTVDYVATSSGQKRKSHGNDKLSIEDMDRIEAELAKDPRKPTPARVVKVVEELGMLDLWIDPEKDDNYNSVAALRERVREWAKGRDRKRRAAKKRTIRLLISDDPVTRARNLMFEGNFKCAHELVCAQLAKVKLEVDPGFNTMKQIEQLQMT